MPESGSRHILVEAELDGRGPYTLLLDTGYVAPFMVAMSPGAAERAGAEPSPGPPFISRAAVGGPVRFERYALGRLALGPVRLNRVSVGVTDAIEIVARGLDIRLDGIIGHDFLTGRVVAIDYPCGRADLRATIPATAPTASFTVAPIRPLLLVTARINGRGPYRLVLDTGAGTTLLAPGAAAEAGVEARGSISLTGAGGDEAGSGTGRAAIALGTAPARRIVLVVAPLVDRVAREAGARIDGIAGTNLFAHARLVLDYPRRQMWLLPPRPCA